MPLKSLADVIQEALSRPQFLDELLSNPGPTLERMEWELSLEDKDKLEELIRYRMDVTQAVSLLTELYARSTVPWPPPPWNPVYPWPPRPRWLRER